jgi:hypothetical protein
MMESTELLENKSDTAPKNPLELTPLEYSNIMNEIMDQPQWRQLADKCHEYYDGNQTDSETLKALESIGMVPQIENLFAPTIDAITGLEAKTRKDWQVSAQNSGDFENVIDALGQKMFEAEQQTYADRANTDAFKGAVVGGIGWLHVGRNNDPFKYPYKYQFVHRDEMYWDMKFTLPDCSDMRWLLRSKWFDVDIVKNAFPDKKELIELAFGGWNDLELYLDSDKLQEALQYSHEVQRTYPLDGYDWVNSGRKRIRVNEVWMRRWVTGLVIRLPNGAVEEFDENNGRHMQAAYSGYMVTKASYTKLRVSFWVGMHKLLDIDNPYKHGEMPYIPVFGNLEDKTRSPYGEGKSMIHMQDEINTRNTKMIWLLAAKRITMTTGITVDDVETVREEAGRPDAVHILNPEALRTGGMFKVETDFALNQQQYNRLADARQQMKMVAGVFAAFEGSSNNQSGIALQQATEQSSQTLANLYDNHQFARSRAGNQLLSLIMEDIGDKETPVVIESDFEQPKTVVLNQKNKDGSMSNALNMTRMKVVLSDVPSTASFKQHTLQHLTQITQGLPPQYQAVMIKFMIKLTDVSPSDKQEILDAIAKVNGEQVNKPPKTPEEAQAMQAQQQAIMQQQQMQMRAAMAELELKEAQATKAKAEAQGLMNSAETSDPEKEKLKAKVAEYEQDLIKAQDEFNTKRLEIEERKNTALEVERIKAKTQITIAQMTNKDKQTIAQMEAELADIERLLNLDTQSSDTDNPIPA